MAKSLSRIKAQIDTVKRKISQIDYVIRGSVSEVSMTCGNPDCICKRDPARVHGPYHYFTKSVAGKTKGFKLKDHEVLPYKKAVENYKKLKRLVERYCTLSEEALDKLCRK